MPSSAIVDAGPLFAWISRADPSHRAVRDTLARSDIRFLVSGLSLVEATYLVAERRGSSVEHEFVSRISSSMAVVFPEEGDWPRITELMRQYADFPLGLVDASVVALAERLDIDTIATLDHRHFRAVRPRHCPAFTLLP